MSETVALSYEQVTERAERAWQEDRATRETLDPEPAVGELASAFGLTGPDIWGRMREVQREHGWGRSNGEDLDALSMVAAELQIEADASPAPPKLSRADVISAGLALASGQEIELSDVCGFDRESGEITLAGGGSSWMDRQKARRTRQAAQEAYIRSRSMDGSYDRTAGLAARGGRRAGSMWQAPPDDSTSGGSRSAQEIEGLVSLLAQRSPGMFRTREPDRHPSRESEPRAPHERIREHVIGDESPSDLASIERYARMAKQVSGKTSPGRQVRSRLEAGPLPQGHRRNPRNGAAVLPPLSRDQQHAGRIAARPGGSAW